MRKHFVLLIALTTLFSSALCSVDLKRVFQDISEEGQLEFLKFHVKRGYDLATADKFNRKFGFIDEFSIKLYRTLAANSALFDPEKQSIMAACIVCFPNGKCIDLCDPGVHP